jgi:hypothetical protein
MRKTFVASVIGAAGLALSALGQSRVELQVSRALQEDWHSSIIANPGDSIDIRVLVSYTGANNPLGLSSLIFQPTVSNWIAGGDVMAPLVNGGRGSQATTPMGAVYDRPGQYGAVIPYGATGYGSSNYLRGHVNNVNGVTYLRIAQAQVTSWIGDSGNTSGGSGINIRQLNNTGRSTANPQPPFSSVLDKAVIFKFNITLSPTSPTRTMTVDAPINGFYLYPISGNRDIGWFKDMVESPGSERTIPTVFPATISVHQIPAPGGMVVMMGVFVRRKRRSAS